MTTNKTNGRCFDCAKIKNFNKVHYTSVNKNLSKGIENFSQGIKNKFSCINALLKGKDQNTTNNIKNILKNIINSLNMQNSNNAKFLSGSHSLCLNRRRLFCIPIANLSSVVNIFPNQSISSFKYTNEDLSSFASAFINYSDLYANFSSNILNNYSTIIDTLLNNTICQQTAPKPTNGNSNGTKNGSSNSTDNGNSNATKNGTSNSTANGTSNGTTNGTSNATKNGTSNSTANGTSNSTANGTSNGTSNSTANGTSNGTSNSTANGTSNSTANGTSNSSKLLRFLQQPISVSTVNNSSNCSLNKNMKTNNCKPSDKCSQDFINACNSSGLFNLSNIFCPSILPAECNQTIASRIFGSKWIQNCGIWVINNVLGDRCRISLKRAINLCQVVNISNTNFFIKYPNATTRRELIASTSDIIPSSQDPTVNDTVASLTPDDLSSTTSAITIDGSTTTLVVTANDTDIAIMDSTGNSFAVDNINILPSTNNTNGDASDIKSGSNMLEFGFILALISLLI